MAQFAPGPCQQCKGPTEQAFMEWHCIRDCSRSPAAVAAPPTCELDYEPAMQALSAGVALQCSYCPCDSGSDKGSKLYLQGSNFFFNRLGRWNLTAVGVLDISNQLAGWGGHRFTAIDTPKPTPTLPAP